jgi:hypothetical protein
MWGLGVAGNGTQERRHTEREREREALREEMPSAEFEFLSN